MPKRVNPDTSIAAYHEASAEMISGHHTKIIAALRLFPKGLMYEQIAAHTRMDKHQVGRRLLELERMKPAPLIYKTDEKIKTASGRAAYVYKLTPAGEALMLPGKTVSDYSKAIQSIQPTLF